MLEIQSFIAVDGLGKEKQMFHGHHFTPLSPELAMGHHPLYRQGTFPQGLRVYMGKVSIQTKFVCL